MKKYIILSIVLIGVLLGISLYQRASTTADPSAAMICDISNSTWVKGPSIPGNHMEAATAVVGSKFYIISGFSDSALNLTSRVDVYDPNVNQWETATKPRKGAPVPVSHAQGAADSRYIWVAGGFIGKQPGTPTDRVWRYDTLNDSWSELPKLPQKRAAGLLVLENRTLHYTGGTSFDRNTSYGDHWMLNVDDTGEGWQSAPAMPNKRIHSSGAYLNGMIYAIGGQYKHDNSPQDLNLVHAFNVATNSWSQKANLPFPRSHFEGATIMIGGQIVIIGGRANQNGYGNGQIVNVTAYNPAKNSWKEMRQLPIKLIATNAAYIGNQMIVAGGGINWNTITRDMYTSTVTTSNCSDSATATAIPTRQFDVATSTPTSMPPTETSSVTPVVPTNTAVPSTATPTPLLATNTPTNNPSLTPVTPTSTPAQVVTRFILVNALSDQDIMPLENGAVIDCAIIGTNKLNVRVETSPWRVGSVVFGLNSDPRYKVENGDPYTIASNNGQDYFAWLLVNGNYSVRATPYDNRNGSGTAGTGLQVNITLTRC